MCVYINAMNSSLWGRFDDASDSEESNTIFLYYSALWASCNNFAFMILRNSVAKMYIPSAPQFLGNVGADPGGP